MPPHISAAMVTAKICGAAASLRSFDRNRNETNQFVIFVVTLSREAEIKRCMVGQSL